MNILIIKVGALGDVVRTSFIAQALKDKYRENNPKITWVTDEKAKPLFINNPYVNELISKENKKNISNRSWDLVINLEEDEENCRFVSSLNYHEFIGFFWKGEKVLPTSTMQEWYNMSALGKKPENDILKKKNKKSHRQILGEILNINWKKYEPFLRLNENQRQIAKNFLRIHNIRKDEFVIGINTGSADRWPKQLSIKKTSELIEKIHKKFNAKILLFGGPNEIERNQEIIQETKAPIISTGCGNDLVEFPALISTCSLFITSDSLGLHIALALKRSTICLLGPTSNAEIDMYSLGEKVIADSTCLCCYKKDCKSMERIKIEEIVKCVDKIRKQKITLVITAFKEPKIAEAINSALNQKTKLDYEVIVSAPDQETLSIAEKLSKKDKRLKIFKDPGKGKSYALNLIFEKFNTDILILTDGDVTISNNSVEEITNQFLDPEVGCVTGHPIPLEDGSSKYGYWANFLFEAAHQMRKNSYEKNNFLECSGYLFAFRKKFISEIPLDVAEDTVIPYYFWEKGFRISYAENANVCVKNVDNWKDWIKQKTRTSKAHETLNKYVDIKTTPRVKNFKTESRGITQLLSYPKNISEYWWSAELVFARLYMWIKVFYDTKFKQKNYNDAWERVESTK